MLHKYEKIDEAMAACVALEYPLIVIVHGKLPEQLNHAEEATRGTGGNTRAATAATYSFLPPSYSTGASQTRLGANNSSSLFADDTVPLEATLTAPTEDAANANASLGYLMRPANLTATADQAAVAQAVADGEELSLVTDFPLGRLQGGAAQREALLITLLESRLGSVSLLHLVEEGTPAFDSFNAAVPIPHTNGSDVAATLLPRVHLFFAPTVGIAPMALHGATLTPQNLHNCVQMGLLRPRQRATGAPTASTAGAGAGGLRSLFTTAVASMNAEYARSRQQQASSPPAPPTQHGDPSARPASASATAPTAGTPVMSTPAVRAIGVSRADALKAAHLISVAGLPTCFANGPVPGSNSTNSGGGAASASTTPGTHKTILTTPSMTMQTVWRAVEKHLEWAAHEVQQAQAAAVWNGVSPPKPGSAFTLTVDKKDDRPEAAVVVKSYEEAGRVRLQDFPRNTVVRVDFGGSSAGQTSTAAAASVASPPKSTAPTTTTTTPATASGAEDYVCEGDVCRRRQPGEVASTPTQAPAPAPAASAATSSASPPAASIKLHCSLPNGKTLDVDHLDPAVDTLQFNVRPAVEEALGYSNFLFVCAYPARRYSVDTDEPQPLRAIGLGRSSALRVVSADGPGSPNAAAAPGQRQQQQQAGPTRQLLANAASSLLGMLGGRRTNPSSEDNNSTSNSNSQPQRPTASAPPRRTYNSMAEMLAANEAAEQETAKQRLRQEQEQDELQQQRRGPFPGQDPADQASADARPQGKKSNRYFGGGSTEYIAEDDAEARAAVDGMTPAQQSAFLRGQLQRMMQQYRHNGDAGEEGEEEEEEKGDDEGRGSSQRGPSSGGQRRVFQGQGRRLAGDAPSAGTTPPSNSAEASSQQQQLSDNKAAKKNQ